MTPSQRAHMADATRRIRMAEQRDPVEAALFAVAALSRDDRQKFADSINAVFGKRHFVLAITEVLA